MKTLSMIFLLMVAMDSQAHQTTIVNVPSPFSRSEITTMKYNMVNNLAVRQAAIRNINTPVKVIIVGNNRNIRLTK